MQLLDSYIEALSERIKLYGLEAPAVIFLEASKPLSFLFSQLIVMATPMLAAIFSYEGLEKLHQLLSDRQNIEKLIQKLEQ